MKDNVTLKQLEQGSEEWLALRKEHITGTDAAVILGVSPWNTPFGLWEQKLGLRPPEPENPRMLEGRYLEDFARDDYCKKYEPMSPSVVFHPTEAWTMASLDGINFDRDIILEIKCGEGAYKKAEKAEVPKYYQAQIQHNLFVSGAKECHYWAWRPNLIPIMIKVLPDEKYQQDLLKKEREFFNSLKEKTAPKKGKGDVDFIGNADHPFRIYEKEWYEAKQQADYWSNKADEIKESLITYAGECSCQGLYAKVTPYESKGQVPYRKIWEEQCNIHPELQKVNVDEYRGESKYSYRLSAIRKEEDE